MAYIKLDETPDSNDLPASEDNEAASDEARAMMRDINVVSRHVDEILRVLRTIPLSTSRRIAEEKAMEVRMWAGQAFIESDL